MEETLVAGIGDEVVLFVAFLFFSLVVFCFLSMRSRRPQEPHHRPNDEPVITDNSSDENNQETNNPRQRITTSVLDEGVAEDSTLMRLRLVMERTTRTITVPESTTLQHIQNQYLSSETSMGQRIRFIYQGRVLNDTGQTLAEMGIQNDTSIHVHLSLTQGTSPTLTQNEPVLDISVLFIPLFGVMLGIFWISLLLWPQLFTFPTKFLLFLLSVGFVFLAYRSRLS